MFLDRRQQTDEVDCDKGSEALERCKYIIRAVL